MVTPMARLNEPVAPTESVESLKRRFLRQNRELAKSNSNQSIRIRALEAEIAKLISENITLRDRNLQLEGQVSGSRANHVFDNVQVVQSRLEAKVEEMSKLVLELGTVRDRGSRQIPASRTVVLPSASRPWKSPNGSIHMHGAISTSMPAIVEGKQYPRTSSSRSELQILQNPMNDNSLSPDIGPPPVAHLEPEETASQDGKHTSSGDATQYLDDVVPVNLESRRRKRESMNPDDIRRASMFDQSPERVVQNTPAGEDVSKPPRAGAKRKYDDGGFENTPAVALADSTSARRTTASRPQRPVSAAPASASRRTANEAISASRTKPRERSTEDVPLRDRLQRKALAPKSTNLEPTSPVKSNRGSGKEKNTTAKQGDRTEPTERKRAASVQESVVNISSVAPAPANTVDVFLEPAEEPPPETPAGLDLFSPLSSQPSTDRRGLQDTPPPPELDPTTSTGDALTGAGRGGRRARGNVSYAEPNLRDKMRRPTKDLVDAVTGEARNRHSISAKPEPNRSDSEGPVGSDSKTYLARKGEPDVSWKSIPSLGAREQEYRAGATSPLGGKKSSEEDARLPLTITTDRKRRQSALLNDSNTALSTQSQAGPGPASASVSAATISTLIASSKRAKENERRKQAQQQSMDQAMQNLNIYDFEATSSPPPPVEQKRPSKEQLARKREERRRNSLVTVSTTNTSGREKGSPETDGEVSASEGASRTRVRRQTLATTGRKINTATAAATAGGVQSVDTTAGIGPDNTSPPLTTGEDEYPGSRAASRRRSMMI